MNEQLTAERYQDQLDQKPNAPGADRLQSIPEYDWSESDWFRTWLELARQSSNHN